jgi:hypothetical protein
MAILKLWNTFEQEARMAPHTRAELVAEIAELRRRQFETAADAMFGCWTREEQAEYQERANLLTRVVLEVEMLDEIAQRVA